MTAQQLKNSILQMAVQGRLVEQNPHDEPASELLKKVQAEKAKLVKEGKIKASKHTSVIYKKEGSYFEKVGASERCIDEEIPFDIPETWEWVRLGEIVTKLTDGAHLTPKYTNKGVPFISVKDISSGRLCFDSTKFISEKEHKELFKRCNPEKGDIILSKVGTTGIPVLVDTDKEFSLFVSVALLKFSHQYLNPQFLIDLINSPLVQIQCTQNTKGVGNKNWVIRDIAHTLVCLPPLAEQQRIVEKIEGLLPSIEEYDKAHKEIESLNKDFPDQVKKSILQWAVQGRLVEQNPHDEPASELLKKVQAEKAKLVKEGKIKASKHTSVIYKKEGSYFEKVGASERCIDEEIPFDIPETWEWVRLGEIGDWGSGATPSRTNPEFYNNGTIPWLKTGDLTDGYIIDIPEKITELALTKTSVRINPTNSVLIAMYGATIGKLGILTYPATTNQACCACVPFSGVSNKFLFYFLMSHKFQFIQRGEGGAQPNISKEKIVATLLPLPPLAEQQRIVEKIEGLLKIITEIHV